jgi:hypothetical protein
MRQTQLIKVLREGTPEKLRDQWSTPLTLFWRILKSISFVMAIQQYQKLIVKKL